VLCAVILLVLAGCTSYGGGGLFTKDPDADWLKLECFDGAGTLSAGGMAASANAIGKLSVRGLIKKGDPTDKMVEAIMELGCPGDETAKFAPDVLVGEDL
jgi:hypothetical protein